MTYVNMMQTTFNSLKPRNFDEFMGYIFMQDAPEEVGSKDTFDDNFDRWYQHLTEQDIKQYQQQFNQLKAN